MKTTRFENIGYKKVSVSRWHIYDLSNTYPAVIGSIYKTEKELLSDLDRFTKERGYQ